MRKMEEEVKKEKKQPKRMAKGEVEKKKKIIIRTFFAIVTLMILGFVLLIANDFIILDKNKKTNLVINNKNITANLKNDVLIEDNMIYLSKADIANFFDKYIEKDEKTTEGLK